MEPSSKDQIRKIFIGGLSRDTTNDNLRGYFEAWGNVVDSVVMRDPHTGNSRGFGFIVFETPESVDQLLKAKKEQHEIFTIDGRDVEVKRALPKVDGQSTPVAPTRSGKIFVGGVAAGTTEEDFTDYFSQYGAVTEVELLKDKFTLRLRGFGFVTFRDEDVADKVCQFREHTINGKTCEVKKAQPRGHVNPPRRESSRYDQPYSQNRYDNSSGGGRHYGYGSHGDQSSQQFNPNLQQALAAALGLGGQASALQGLAQSGYGQPGLGQTGLAQGGLSNLNNILIASLLGGGGSLPPVAPGLGNANLLNMLASQGAAAQPQMQPWNTADYSAGSVNQAQGVADYSRSGGAPHADAGNLGYAGGWSTPQYDNADSSYGPSKSSKPGGGQGGAGRNYRPY